MEDIPTFENIILLIIIFSIGFFSSFLMYSNFVKLVNKIKNSYKKYKKKDNVEYVKQLIDDFDHIACDNVLISKEFIAHFVKEKNEVIINLKHLLTMNLYITLNQLVIKLNV